MRRELTWLGHATVLLDMGGVRLLTDPVLGHRVGLLRRVVPALGPDAVERVDAVLLSHLHADHADLPSLRRVATTGPILAPPGAVAWLGRRGFRDLRELTAGSVAQVGDVRVEATPAHHDGRRWPRGPAAEAIGYRVDGVYFAGDTDLFPGMATLAGQVDVALLPVSGWGPGLGPGHLDPERAARALTLIRPRVAVPIHWGTLGRPWARPREAARARPARAFAAAAAELAPDVEVRLLDPGERTRVD